MTHPHILQKSLVEITAAAKESIENLYSGAEPSNADDVFRRYHTALGILMLWTDISFDMGTTPVVNMAYDDSLSGKENSRVRTMIDRVYASPSKDKSYFVAEAYKECKKFK